MQRTLKIQQEENKQPDLKMSKPLNSHFDKEDI